MVRKAICTVAAAAVALPVTLTPASAQRGKLPLVRDAEIEDLLRDYATPIFKAAGIANAEPQIILVNDKSFNAFVPDSRRMFINIGVIMESETPGEVIGVIAHETGHIAGRHLVRLRSAAANAQIISVIGMILGAGAATAGAAAGSGSAASGGAAAALGAGSVGQRSLLSYQRGEEAAADRAALRYLNATGQSPRGLLKTFQRMSEQQMFSRRFADPYAQSHPMAQERFNGLVRDAQSSKYFDKPEDYVLQYRHDLARAKLFAFTSHPSATLRAYPRSDKSPAAQYARAIAAMQSRGKAAVKEIDALIRTQPNNPYYYELKGQALLEGGDPRGAIAPFRKALSFKPNEPQFLVWLGYALVGANNPAYLPEAERILKRAIQRDPNSGVAYAQLAIAHGRQGERAEADLATAKSLMVRGDFEAAKRYAARAQQSLKRGTPAWLQADDIVSYKPPNLQRRG
ncbi:M48 family peptidase [Roseibium denhamense]|uniref:Zn-dependent protease, contains TPR repeats n=1 Tax=Roseibium denhamense TaxID=76305 RepID=A0ABY1PGF7_9HYPH|nr:M48 family metalloprotease [Roseibium denhamense]MTI04994.1 M48 family peptidase [Roseibium denhamense]SMP33263.1 Putative Zn-dependent protease, contains TPR repeats [Roseibium denhamense]